MSESPTVSDLLLGVSEIDAYGISFEDQVLSWREHIQYSFDRAALLDSLLDHNSPRHFGLLMENIPEFSLLLGAAAFSGTVAAGLNTTRRGPALARDVELSDCQIIFTENNQMHLLEGVDLGAVRVVNVDSPEWQELLAPFAHSPQHAVAAAPDDLLMLIFTSGTSGDPKAVRCTHHKIADPAIMLGDRFGLGPDDVVYMAMPMFHSNAIMAAWAIALHRKCAIGMRRKFSASGFLPDVRKFGITFSNYVGKPLSFIASTPEQPDDHDNTLRIMYGNEGSAPAVATFVRRFDARVIDGFGSTEGGVSIGAAPVPRAGTLGLLPDSVKILHPDTGVPCPPAQFDSDGRITNADEATGEMVNVTGPGTFAGYYKNPEADAERMRGGKYWSGDLAYADADGYVYFAGRSSGWLRVDGENIGAAPIERALTGFPGFAHVSVYAVPDSDVGDRVMVSVIPVGDVSNFDPEAVAAYIDSRPELGPKQKPTLIRVCSEFPRTATFKVVTRTQSAERWNTTDPVWIRQRGEKDFQLLTPERALTLEKIREDVAQPVHVQ
ncbi:long-chain-fatty-acid--CoA ligase [Rhodococcus sp. IEGM 1379]|uniref:long-chain-fatty-acid--CoA ligase n=1 Tax=Rhodococcus sp. IEGM 1379 TaxID=3047086 RepID=UPI0024B86949|nr:long-chain-fatty-acid--CoA ligase [Rhodococcus sp. IEGM 1379]MDI9915998.1 long-chain-fatty-acid--CoA ligase [Rhodococcus sp. IEGM 1379]